MRTEAPGPVNAGWDARILAALPVGVIVFEGESVVYVNDAAVRIVGAPRETLLAATASLIDPADRERVWSRLQARLRGDHAPARYEFHVLPPDGTRRRVELEGRQVAPGVVVATLRDLGERVRDAALLGALSELAARVQRGQSPADVLALAGSGLAHLGLHVGVIRVAGATGEIEHLTAPADALREVEALVGRPLAGLTFPLPRIGPVERWIAEGRAVFVDDVGPHLVRFLSGLGAPEGPTLLEAAVALTGGKTVVAPLRVRGVPWGALLVGAASLDGTDAAALRLFAAQVAAALESAESLTALQGRNRELAAVNEIARAVSDREIERLVPELLAVAARTTAADACALYLHVDEEDALVLAGTAGEGIRAAADRHRRIALDGTITGAVARSLRPTSVPAERWPEELRALLTEAGLRQGAVVPLHLQGRLAGVLHLGRRAERPFAPEELHTAETLGAQLAVQVENARLQGEAGRRIRFLSVLWDLGRAGSEARAVAPLVERVLRRLADALEVDAAAIHAVEDGRLVLAGPRFGLWEPVPEEEMRSLPIEGTALPGLAVTSRHTVVEALPERRLPGSLAGRLGVRHSATVPLLAQDRAVGTLSVVRHGDRPFLAEEVQLLESCAAQVSVALENARLFEQKRRRVLDLSVLNELSAVVASQLEVPAVLSTGVRHLARMFAGLNVFLVLVEPDGSMRVAASSVDAPWLRDLRLPADQPSAAREAVRLRQPVILNDARADARAARAISERLGHRALLAVPLVSRGEALGAVVLGEPRPDRPFAPTDLDRVTAMASQLAAAIANAHLFATERRRVEQLRLLLEIGRTITGSLDLEQILETSAAALVRMVEADTAHVFLLDAGTRLLRGAATSDPSHRHRIRAARIDLDEPSVAARSVTTRAPVAVADVAASLDEVKRELAETLGERSLLALPLLVRDEPIGAVVIGDVKGPRRWSGSELERASVVAHQVAVAVANARLFDDLRRSYGELARAQEELVKRERLAALGELSAVVAHEVRNPLGVIFNSLASLRRILHPTGDAAMLLEIVGEEADRLNRIVGDLLDFARPHEPSLQAASLGALLEDVLDAARADPAARGIAFVVDVPAELPPVRIDARMIRQALVNVIQNACQAMPRGGRLQVRARTEVDGGRAFATVDVADEGPGIPPEYLARIFQPFFTTKATGTGLGLAVVKRILEAHRGSIAVASRVPRGTTFTIRLPADEGSR